MRRLRYGTAAWRRWFAALPRGDARRPEVERVVARILGDVAREGDRAVVRWTRRLDRVSLRPSELRVPPAEVRGLAARADRTVKSALRGMAGRIESFHAPQKTDGFRLRTSDGSRLEEVVTPLDSVALYVPGGRGAYPSSVLMNAIPARVAGVARIAVVTPPRALEASPSVAAALVLMGLEGEVYRIGGAQAIGAVAYGTDAVRPVAKVVGPGNAYVAAAKRQVSGRIGVDQEAGPSEVAILADDTADPGWLAADLLAQAEHGSGDETAVLITPSADLAAEVKRLVNGGRTSVANPESTARALARYAAVVLVSDVEEGIAAVNVIAPEHVEVMTRSAESVARRVIAGAVFVGPYAPVAVGDYGVGPNHVLPTGGSARYGSPLSVRDFQRRHSRVFLTRTGLARVTSEVVAVAMSEGFRGHAQSVLTRWEG